MKAMTLPHPASIESHPLELEDIAVPEAAEDEVLIEVSACGICRTDLHVVEGELPPRLANVIPGHQVVGRVVRSGSGARKHSAGTRVGIPWLHRTDGTCEFCRRGHENLCPRALFTGWTVNGGYAEFITAPEEFVYPIPDGFSDLLAAPLLCAGIIGFRALRLAELQSGD